MATLASAVDVTSGSDSYSHATITDNNLSLQVEWTDIKGAVEIEVKGSVDGSTYIPLEDYEGKAIRFRLLRGSHKKVIQINPIVGFASLQVDLIVQDGATGTVDLIEAV